MTMNPGDIMVYSTSIADALSYSMRLDEPVYFGVVTAIDGIGMREYTYIAYYNPRLPDALRPIAQTSNWSKVPDDMMDLVPKELFELIAKEQR